MGIGYARPETLDALLDLVATDEGARIVAGGTDLMLAIRAGRTYPTLVNVSRILSLRELGVRDGALVVGATVTVARLLRSAEVREHTPLLWQAADKFASPLVRSRATVGGNLCNASPAADLTLALVALDAEVEVASRAGRRALPAEAFATGPGRTALAAGEVVTAVRIPLAEGRFHHFEKSGTRPALEISIAAVAVALSFDQDRVVRPRIALGAVAPVPLRARAAEAALEGRPLTDETIAAAARAAAAEARPIDDVRATAVYRRRLVGAFVRRALVRARDERTELDATGS